MKATDFRPEHFEKGRNFNRSDFNAYIQASANLTRTLFTKYIPCMLGGVIVGGLLSGLIGGFSGNILALLCIFGGIILGGVFNAQAAKPVNEIARRLGITKADVAQARKHVKNGTVAWGSPTGSSAAPNDRFAWDDRFSRDDRFSGDNRFDPVATRTVTQKASATLPEAPERAAWAAGALTAGWLLLMLCQIGPLRSLSYSSYGYLLIAGGILGSAVYLMARSELQWRLFGAGAGLVSAILLNAGAMSVNRAQLMQQGMGLSIFFFFREPPYLRSFCNCLLAAALGLGAALLVSILNKKEGPGRVRLSALAAAAVVFLVRMYSQTHILRYIFKAKIQPPPRVLFMQVLSVIMPCLAPALAVYLVCMAVWYLCRMSHTRVKLRGLGFAWACLALAGSLGSILITWRSFAAAGPAGLQIPGISVPFTSQIILGLCGLVGYALLLSRRRAGLYVIVIGIGLMLGAQALQGLVAGSRFVRALVVPALFGALNPLFAWLAVRAGETPEEARPHESLY